MSTTFSVALIGSTRLNRDVLAARLATAGLTVSASATTAEEYADALPGGSAKVIVLLDTEDGAQELARLTPHLEANQRIAVLGSLLSGGVIALELAAAGRLAWITREMPWQEVVRCIQGLPTQAASLSPQLLAAGLSRLRQRNTTKSATPAAKRLTRREQEVAQLISDGLLNKQIARRLGIPLGTVKSDAHRLMHKLEVRSRRSLKQSSFSFGGTL